MRAMADEAGRRPTPGELLARAEAWRPWRAYAAQHLWASDAAQPPKSPQPRRSKTDARHRHAAGNPRPRTLGDPDRDGPAGRPRPRPPARLQLDRVPDRHARKDAAEGKGVEVRG